MRTLTLAFSLFLGVVTFAGCPAEEGGFKLPDLAGRDMATVQNDLSMRLNGCNGYLACLVDQNTTQQECDDGSTDEAKTLLTTLDDCLGAECFMNMDADAGGMPSCQGNSDNSARCSGCIQRVIGTNGACSDELRACRANRP